MLNDPIVEEVREAGAKLAKKCDYDIKKFAKMLKAGEKKSKKLGWKFVSPKSGNKKVKL